MNPISDRPPCRIRGPSFVVEDLRRSTWWSDSIGPIYFCDRFLTLTAFLPSHLQIVYYFVSFKGASRSGQRQHPTGVSGQRSARGAERRQRGEAQRSSGGLWGAASAVILRPQGALLPRSGWKRLRVRGVDFLLVTSWPGADRDVTSYFPVPPPRFLPLAHRLFVFNSSCYFI